MHIKFFFPKCKIFCCISCRSPFFNIMLRDIFSLSLTGINYYFFQFYTTPSSFICNDTVCSQPNRSSYFKLFLPQHLSLLSRKHTHSSRAHENMFVLSSFQEFSKGNALFNVHPRRGTSLPGIVQRTAATSRSHSRRGSNGQRRADISAGGSC